MALKLNERYPGRFDNPSADYPQGSFKNRTTPTAKDGSYLERDWANDKEGFFQSLIAEASIVPSGAVDKVGASQFFDALNTVIAKTAVGRLIGVRNFSSSGTYTYTPTAGTKSVVVEVQGAGGSGGGTAATSAGQAAVGGGGAAGAYTKGRFTSGFSGLTVTVGIGGAQTAAGNNNGNAGATSSFGALLTALGGGGGAGGLASSSFPFASAGGVGTGVPTGGIVNKAGSSAVQPIALLANVLVGSEGASSLFGRGGQSFSTSGNGGPGLSGAGGGGACAGGVQPAFFGGNGGSGQVTIWEYA